MANEWYHPSVTADIVALTDEHKILLIKRSDDAKAFPGCHALPGGFMDAKDGCIEDAAARELKEETGLKAEELVLLGVYTKKNRDPRGPVHSTAFLSFFKKQDAEQAKNGDDASEVNFWEWSLSVVDIGVFRITLTQNLGLDHREIWLTCKKTQDKYGIVRYEVRQDTYNSGKLAFDHAQIVADALIKTALNT